MKQIYPCSPTPSVRWITRCTFIIWLIAWPLFLFLIAQTGFRFINCLLIAIWIISPILVISLSPIYIEATDEWIGIRTPFRRKRIPYDQITSIKRPDHDIRNNIRVCGCGGVGGWTGWFRDKEYGLYLSYVTDFDKVFVIFRKEGKPIFISVDDPDEFMPYFLKNQD